MISSLFHLARTARIGFVLAREGALALVDPSVLPPLARAGIRLGRLIERPGAGSSATRLAAALTRLGPSYVKFGQFLATRPDVVGMRIAADLSALQDRMPPFPMEQARADDRRRPWHAGRAGLRGIQAARGRRLDRAGAPGPAEGWPRGRGEGAAAGHSRPVPARSRCDALWRGMGGAALGRSPAAALHRRGRHAGPLRDDGDGSAAGSGRPVRIRREHQRGRRFPRAGAGLAADGARDAGR